MKNDILLVIYLVLTNEIEFRNKNNLSAIKKYAIDSKNPYFSDADANCPNFTI